MTGYASTTKSRRLDFVYAEGKVIAVHVMEGNSESLYYLLTDHLGSWNKVMDQNKTIVQQTHFDPWGNRMSYTSWSTPQAQISFSFHRGFTGHEHYDRFKVINANARLYDPVIGRFFSPDPFVQAPDFTQNYNRYSYCMNNPVMYSDPDGEFVLTTLAWIGIGVATVIGGYSGYKVAASMGYNFNDWQTYGYILGGAAIGFASGYVGAGISTCGGFMANTAGIFGSSLVNTTGMTMLSGGTYTPSISLGFASYNFSLGEWSYLGKKGNTKLQNIGYCLGALANVQDLVTGFNGSSYQYQYEKSKGRIGHANIRRVSNDENGNLITEVEISVANKNIFNAKSNLDWVWKSNFKKYTGGGEFWPRVPEQGWERIPLQLNTKIVDWMHGNLVNGKGLWGITETRFGINYGCVSYAARALWTTGVPTVPIINYLGPSVLWTQLAIRQLGIQESPFLIDGF